MFDGRLPGPLDLAVTRPYYSSMEELFFFVQEEADGTFTARGMGVPIFSQAETLEELRAELKDAIHCHFDDNRPPNSAVEPSPAASP